MNYLCAIGYKVHNTKLLSSVIANIQRTLNSTVHKRQLNITCQVEQLTTRSLLKVSGEDVESFMQGLITNDIRHLESGSKSLYTMFLNTKGRVMFDSIIYKCPSANELLIECDVAGVELLEKHLKLFRVRRKIDVKAISDQLQIWVLFNPLHVEQINKTNGTYNKKDTLQERIVPCTVPHLENQGQQFLNDLLLGENIYLYSDPRISTLGTRVLAPTGKDIVAAVKNNGITIQETQIFSYKMFRYALGVGEGIEELPLGKCFPLEANCDYLHGVSFHKGCYIGQELTARTHHTGVVRKRLMPLLLEAELSNDAFQIDASIEDAEGKKKTSVGKLRGMEKNVGIGLMRIAEAMESSKLKVGSIYASTIKPFWWPQELPKERMDYKKE